MLKLLDDGSSMGRCFMSVTCSRKVGSHIIVSLFVLQKGREKGRCVCIHAEL